MNHSGVIFSKFKLITFHYVLILAKGADPDYNIIFFLTAFFNDIFKLFTIRFYLLPIIDWSLILN